jgi:hypothetical protein
MSNRELTINEMDAELSDSELAMISSGRFFSININIAAILLGYWSAPKDNDRPCYP